MAFVVALQLGPQVDVAPVIHCVGYQFVVVIVIRAEAIVYIFGLASESDAIEMDTLHVVGQLERVTNIHSLLFVDDGIPVREVGLVGVIILPGVVRYSRFLHDTERKQELVEKECVLALHSSPCKAQFLEEIMVEHPTPRIVFILSVKEIALPEVL